MTQGENYHDLHDRREVLSPSTKPLDLASKRARYESAGCPSYWVTDPLASSIVC